ncbi:MAG TPA: oligopeptide/dipeptide ABC transporter ATP-binding protein, partial [Burkholderiales bacterium]
THDLGVVARYADHVAVMYGGRIVERAPAAELYARPRHPYTRGLLASIVRGELRGKRIDAIPGSPPDLAALPAGCSFAPRCRHVRAECHTAQPAARELAGARSVRCVLAGKTGYGA